MQTGFALSAFESRHPLKKPSARRRLFLFAGSPYFGYLVSASKHATQWSETLL
jgi:hypothetical protein